MSSGSWLPERESPTGYSKAHLNQNFIKDELARSLVPDALSKVIKEENSTFW